MGQKVRQLVALLADLWVLLFGVALFCMAALPVLMPPSAGPVGSTSVVEECILDWVHVRITKDEQGQFFLQVQENDQPLAKPVLFTGYVQASEIGWAFARTVLCPAVVVGSGEALVVSLADPELVTKLRLK